MTDTQTNQQAGHTPGPWSIDSYGDIVSGPYNVCIPYAMKSEDKLLATAAPDLFVALTAILRTVDAQYAAGIRWEPAQREAAHAALAKATGEPA